MSLFYPQSSVTPYQGTPQLRVIRKGAAPAILGILAVVLVLANLGVGGYLVFRSDPVKHASSPPVIVKAPDGFKHVPVQSKYSGGTPFFTTAFSPNNASKPYNDIIIVDAFNPVSDTGKSDAELQSGIRQLLQSLGGTISAMSGTVVAGKRAELVKVAYPIQGGGQLSQNTYFIYSDIALVQVRCQVVDLAQEINQGCQQLIQTMKIKDPPAAG